VYQANDGYFWAAGHWDLAPRPGASWIPRIVEPRRSGFILLETGYLAGNAQAAAVVAPRRRQFRAEQEVTCQGRPPRPLQTEGDHMTFVRRPRHVFCSGSARFVRSVAA